MFYSNSTYNLLQKRISGLMNENHELKIKVSESELREKETELKFERKIVEMEKEYYHDMHTELEKFTNKLIEQKDEPNKKIISMNEELLEIIKELSQIKLQFITKD